MEILGNGIDIVDNDRIRKLIKNKVFLQRIFSRIELDESKKFKDKTPFFSKRFAAKEAFVKSLGIGFRNDLNYHDISISNNKYGKPFFLISKKIKQIIFKKFKIISYNFFLSLSDEKKYSIAFVILQKK